MSTAIEELIEHRAVMLAKRESLAAELKTLDVDMAAVMHVIRRLDPVQGEQLQIRSRNDGRARNRRQKTEPKVTFASGEMVQSMLEVLRDPKTAMNVGDITRAMLTAKDVDPETVLIARLSRRLSTNLQKLADRGRLKKLVTSDGVRWEINR